MVYPACNFYISWSSSLYLRKTMLLAKNWLVSMKKLLNLLLSAMSLPMVSRIFLIVILVRCL